MKIIHKIGGNIIRNKKLLIVREEGEDMFIEPGGRPEKGETPKETLERELKEELGISINKMTFFGNFKEKFNNSFIIMDVYSVETSDEVSPQGEIEEYLWIGKDYKKQNLKIGSIIEKHIMPKLIEQGLIK
ncbi:MAG: NUDIX domain-containing protein [Candidatus Aenigmarchaeota archaeon]|nr:NUDIX domain-containing protein [Candidatus Aenigmarchaeota archaeon]